MYGSILLTNDKNKAMISKGRTPPEPVIPVRISSGVKTPIARRSKTTVGGKVRKSTGKRCQCRKFSLASVISTVGSMFFSSSIVSFVEFLCSCRTRSWTRSLRINLRTHFGTGKGKVAVKAHVIARHRFQVSFVVTRIYARN